ncbi:MAG: TRAP transporter small permease subunit [Granulosicoccus sp.]
MLSTLRLLNQRIAVLIGILLLVCAGVVVVDIVLRRFGGHSFGGTDEISGYVMAIATSWGMSYTLLELGHVRIDLLRGRVGELGRALFDLFSMLILSGVITIIAVRCWPVLARSLENGSRANTPLETPLALVQAPWFAGWVFFAIVSWLTFIAAMMMIIRKEFSSAESAIGFVGEEREHL